jgi:iron(III) transport system substrate-binding protein
VFVLAACGSDDTTTSPGSGSGGSDEVETDAGDADQEDDPGEDVKLTVYSGRSEELVGPIIAQFEDETGIEVAVSYGDTAEKAAQILDEGPNSPADVFFGQDAGALGALSAAGILSPLPSETLDVVDPAYRSAEGDWVGVSGRSRVAVYNTDLLSEDDLPDAIAEFADPEWSGRVGWAPTNGSFQAFVTALRVLEGDDAAADWLTAMADNDTQSYEGNGAIVDAVASGEIEVGLVNHYYLYPRLAEQPDLPAANKFFGDGDPGALVNVAGAGILGTAGNPEAAAEFVDYLLSEAGQTYFAVETWEFPLAAGVSAPDELPALESLTPPTIDLSNLEDLQGTLELIQQAGIL